MAKTNNWIFKALIIITWLIFIGLCIEAGGLLVNFVFSLYRPEFVQNLYQKLDLSEMYERSKFAFFSMYSFILVISLLKAVLFYFIIIILPDKNFSLSSPFNKTIERFILKMSFVSFLIGLFSTWGSSYAEGLMRLGLKMPDLQQMYFDGAGVWWLMC